MSDNAIRLAPDDEVATVLRALGPWEELTAGDLRCAVREQIPAFHKVALRDLGAGERVRKYGAVIGVLTAPVRAGELVHVHNLKSLRARAPQSETAS